METGTQVASGGLTLKDIAVAHILPDPNQPRTDFDTERYEETKASIREIGQQVPITVNIGSVVDGVQHYYIKYGESRWRIHGELGLETIKCVVDPTPYNGKVDVRRQLTQAAENINRSPHTHQEIALLFRKYSGDNPHKTKAEIRREFAAVFGKATTWAANYEILANLRDELLERVDKKGPYQIPFMAATALSRVPEDKQMMILHTAEAQAGTRRDLLHRHIISAAHAQKTHGERRVKHRISRARFAFKNISSRLLEIINQFGIGLSEHDRIVFFHEVMEGMKKEEAVEAIREFSSVVKSIQGFMELLRNHIGEEESHEGYVADTETQPGNRSFWPSARDIIQSHATEFPADSKGVHHIKGRADRY